jgi:uncharacterized protein YgbK (DUF1537 family)
MPAHDCRDTKEGKPANFSPSPQVVILSDDLTGALDASVQFALLGANAVFAFETGSRTNASVLAFSTDSREIPPNAADAKARALVSRYRGATVYKKIDSTLRGNVATELVGAIEESESPWAIIAPAYPEQGRTTLGGCQLVHKVPVAAVHSEGSQVYPVVSSHIPTLLRAHTTLPNRHFGVEWAEKDPRQLSFEIQNTKEILLVFDALTQDHLVTIAKAARLLQSGVLLCGSAGFAQAVAHVWCEGTIPCGVTVPAEGLIKSPTLLVSGSRNPTTEAQLSRLFASDFDVVRVLARPETLLSDDCRALVGELRETLLGGRHAVFMMSGHPHMIGCEPKLACAMGRVVRKVVNRVRPGSLLMIGGETAGAVCRCLDVYGLSLLNELLPGVPIAKIGGGIAAGLPIVTKAGGFGPPDTLVRALLAGQGKMPRH